MNSSAKILIPCPVSFLLTFFLAACASAPTPAVAPLSAAKPTATAMPVAVSPQSFPDLQNSVFALEDKIYGTKKLGTLGLYGELKNCQRKLASRQFGGSGDLLWTEPMDRVTAKEVDVKVTTPDEIQNQAENQTMRFRAYRTILQRRNEEYEQDIAACKAEVAKKEFDANQSSKVMVTEVSKGNMDKAQVNEFLCQFVKKEASLKALMVELFAKGWLSLSDFSMDQNLIASSLKDAKGESRDNGMLFNGWKFVFDQAKVTVGELLSGDKDAKLVAWTYSSVSEVKEAQRCLKLEPQWNY